MATEESFELRIAEVRQETEDSTSITFEVPDDLADTFSFTAGQFLTLAVPSDLTGVAARCYSLSSSPGTGHTVTIKRTDGGYASNWLCDNAVAGETMRVLPPSGIFTPKDLNDDFLLFGGGSGITPVISIARAALGEGSGKVVLFYANRDEASVIFAKELAELSLAYPQRLTVVHWLESVQGLPTAAQLAHFASNFEGYVSYTCGPRPFMKAVLEGLKSLGIPRDRRHQEKFVSLGGNPFGDAVAAAAAEAELEAVDDNLPEDDQESAVTGPVAVEVELDGATSNFDDWDGREYLLVFLEKKGLEAPFSCREGNCSACACVVLEGDLTMDHNEVLEAEDLEDGIRLTCQAKAATETIKISFSG